MSALDKAQKECRKLQEKRDDLQTRLAVAEAERVALEGQRVDLEVKAYGDLDVEAEIALEETEAKLGKNAATQRGISGKIVEITEELNATLEGLRKATLVAEVAEHRRLAAKRGPVAAELAAIDGRMAAITRNWENWQSTEVQAVSAQEEELKSATERYAGCTVSRTITTTKEA